MNDQEIDLVRRARPADPPHDPATKARAWDRLNAEIHAPPRRPHRRVGRRPVVIGMVAAGAAAAVAAALIGGTGPVRSPAPGVTTTARTLELAAQTVEQDAAVPRPRPDQWVYSQLVSTYALSDDIARPDAMLHGKVRGEEWWRFDGRAMAESVQNGKLHVKQIFASMDPRYRPRPRPGDPRFNSGAIGGPAVVNQTPHKLYDYVAGLPADPDALLARVRRDNHDRGRDVTTFGVIAGIFRDDHLIPPKANAALYRALARIPNVHVVNNATDFAGRHGIGVVFDTEEKRDGGPETIVLDPRTYRYMGDETQAVLRTSVVGDVGLRG